MKTFKKVGAIVLAMAIIMLAGCNTEEDLEHNKIVKMCINQGGIPILSHWDDRLTDCLFDELQDRRQNYDTEERELPEGAVVVPEDIINNPAGYRILKNGTIKKNVFCDEAQTELEKEGCVETSGPIVVPIGT